MIAMIPSLFGSGGSFDEVAAVALVALRALLLYLYGVVLIRFGKSRLMGNATALDVVVLIVLGSLLSRGINGTASVESTVVASAVLIACHWLLTWATARWHAIGNLLKGHLRLLVVEGEIDREALRSSHLSEEDLREGMRINAQTEDVALVRRVYKERSGQVTVVRRTPQPKVVETRVEDGVKTVRIEVG